MDYMRHMVSGGLPENDDLLSLALSSKGGEGTGPVRDVQAREGFEQHALTSAATSLTGS